MAMGDINGERGGDREVASSAASARESSNGVKKAERFLFNLTWTRVYYRF